MSFYDEYRARFQAADSDIWLHLPLLFETVCMYQDAQVMELGVRGGESTRALLAGAEKSGGHVWSVDIFEPTVPVADWEATGLWSFTKDDDVVVPVPDGFRPHVLLIDTSHEFEHTIVELRRFVPLVRPGGTVLLHDTEFEPPACPVAAALDQFCRETGRVWTNQTGCFGMGVLYV